MYIDNGKKKPCVFMCMCVYVRVYVCVCHGLIRFGTIWVFVTLNTSHWLILAAFGVSDVCILTYTFNPDSMSVVANS